MACLFNQKSINGNHQSSSQTEIEIKITFRIHQGVGIISGRPHFRNPLRCGNSISGTPHFQKPLRCGYYISGRPAFRFPRGVGILYQNLTFRIPRCVGFIYQEVTLFRIPWGVDITYEEYLLSESPEVWEFNIRKTPFSESPDVWEIYQEDLTSRVPLHICGFYITKTCFQNLLHCGYSISGRPHFQIPQFMGIIYQ